MEQAGGDDYQGPERSTSRVTYPSPMPEENGLLREAAAHREQEARAEPDTELPIGELLRIVIARGASDLHLTMGAPPVIRLHGHLVRLVEYPVLEARMLRRGLYGILTQRNRDRFEENWELDFSHTMPGEGRFRVNLYLQRDAVGAAFRLIPGEIPKIRDLGLPEQIGSFAKLNRGLVLVTGPTGSGKSTTLAALVDVINRSRDVHVMTVEDPIEFVHEHNHSVINQREVGTDTKSFASALRHVLRQDPDVILVGEMRDLETIATALTAAETGHLVFATLHTQDASQTVDRVIDVFPPHQQQQIRIQLAASLQGIVVQQLMPVRQGGGRVVATEVLMATPAIRNLIREAKTHQIYSAIQAGGQFGMQTMDASLARL
ncbi:MAG: type IV pilus twitching motility protein PilT, partial [Actinomycetota bacterium]